MRIVQLANFHGPVSGGIRTTLQSWRLGYRSRGHEVHLIVPGPVDRTTVQAGGAVHELRSLSVRAGYRIIVGWGRVEALLREIGPDVIEVSDRTTLQRAGRWGSAHGVVSLLVLHERLDHQLGAIVPSWVPHRPLVDRWNRRAAGMFPTIVATSGYGAREFSRIGVETSRVPLGVDLEVFRPALDLAPNPRRIVYLGRLSREKRPDLAVDTLQTLISWGHDVDLVFIGAGPMERELRARSGSMPVTFAGYLGDRTEVSRALSGAAVSLVPCPGECFGLAALESMACGTPVVVASNSGAAELVSAGGGLAVPPGPRGFARAVEDLMESATARSEARQVAERHPWARSVEAMLGLYENRLVAV